VSAPRKTDRSRDITRSSAAEYLTFVAAAGDQPDSIEMRYQDENIWLTQKMIAALYGVDVRTVNDHIQTLLSQTEITEDEATIRKFRIVQLEGAREVEREVKHYNLQTILSIGFKVENERAVQFRKWARQVVKNYTIQGWVMDAERLKAGHMFTDEFFERQLEVVREIRLSERKFYQKITDIYSTSIDYDQTSASTQRFFATVQNKLHWAIHGQTAAEVIISRADAERQFMGMNTWKDAPEGKIQRSDVSVAKNYLTKEEMDQLSRLVTSYLDLAESMALRKIPMTMQDWESRLNRFLDAADREILQDAGRVTTEIAKAHAEAEFEKYRLVQDRLFQSDFDRFLAHAERGIPRGSDAHEQLREEN
jgi:hypothetical protein